MEKLSQLNRGRTESWIFELDDRLTPGTRLVIWTALFQVIFLIFWPALQAPFVYDDIPCIVANPDLRYPGEPGRFFSNHRTSMQFDHRPLVGFLTMLNFQLAELNVVVYRIFNLFIHWFVAVLLGEFILKLAAHFKLGGGRLLGLATGVIWAIHPLNTVTVIFIAQRMESLMVLFYLLALWSLLRAGRVGRVRSLVGAVLASVACLGSKEVGIGLLASLLMLDRVCHFRSWRELFACRWKFYGVLTLVWTVFIVWWTSGERIAELQGMPLSDPWLYFKSQCRIIVSYVGKVFWPDDLVFVASPRMATRWIDWFPYAALITAGLGFCAWTALRGRTWLWLPIGLFLFVLGPTSSFLPIPQEPEAEWRMYLPSACVLVIVLAANFSIAVRFEIAPRILTIGALLLGLTLGITSWQRAQTYRTAVSLWSDNVLKDPINSKAWINLGYSYYQERNFEGLARAADSLWQLGTIFDNSWSKANSLQMSAWIEMENKRFGEAETMLRQAWTESPTPSLRIDLAQVLLQQGKVEPAIDELTQVLDAWPEDFGAMALYGEALIKSGEVAAGEKMLSRATEIYPDSPRFRGVRKRLEDSNP